MICKLVLPYSNLTIHIIDIQKTFLQLLSSKSLHLTVYKYNYYFEAKTFIRAKKKKKTNKHFNKRQKYKYQTLSTNTLYPFYHITHIKKIMSFKTIRFIKTSTRNTQFIFSQNGNIFHQTQTLHLAKLKLFFISTTIYQKHEVSFVLT